MRHRANTTATQLALRRCLLLPLRAALSALTGCAHRAPDAPCVAVHAVADDTERARQLFVRHVAQPRPTLLQGQSWGAGVAAVGGDPAPTPAGIASACAGQVAAHGDGCRFLPTDQPAPLASRVPPRAAP